MQNIIKRVIRILVSGYIVKMIRNLISKILTIAIKTITNRNIKTELISNSVFILSDIKIFFLYCYAHANCSTYRTTSLVRFSYFPHS